MERNSEDVEVAGGDEAAFGEHLLVFGVGRLAGDVDVRVVAPVFNGQDVDGADGAHSWNLRNASEERAIKVGDHVAVLVSRGREIDFGGEDVRRIEAEIGMHVAQHRADEKAGDDNEDKREGDLADDEACAEAMLAAADAGVAAQLESAPGISAGHAQGGIERGGKAGENGERDAGAEYGEVELDVGAARERVNEECAHGAEHDPRTNDAAGCAKRGQQQTLSENLANEARAAGADGDAHGHL